MRSSAGVLLRPVVVPPVPKGARCPRSSGRDPDRSGQVAHSTARDLARSGLLRRQAFWDGAAVLGWRESPEETEELQ
jgi:hypothetical protein